MGEIHFRHMQSHKLCLVLKQRALMSWAEHPPLLECYLLPPAALLS